jgi:hypothetical protein
MDNHSMGTVFEELVRKFNEENNEEAGEHWTPRDAVRLMAMLIFLPIADAIRSGSYLLYDGALGIGGMLTVGEETLLQLATARGRQITTHLYGQEINPETYAICKADMLLKGEGESADHIVGGAEWSTLSHDAFSMSQKFGLVPSSQIEEKRLVSESYAGAKLCEKGDLVLNRLKAHLGVFALAPERGLVSPDYTVFRPARELEARYFEAVYRTPACRVELRQRAKGIVQGFLRLYTDDFYDIRMPVPPVDEQKRIMAQFDIDLSGVNAALARLEREISLLREYRTRLVADVVTGKLDVRPAARQLPAEIETPPLVAAGEVETTDPAELAEMEATTE